MHQVCGSKFYGFQTRLKHYLMLENGYIYYSNKNQDKKGLAYTYEAEGDEWLTPKGNPPKDIKHLLPTLKRKLKQMQLKTPSRKQESTIKRVKNKPKIDLKRLDDSKYTIPQIKAYIKTLSIEQLEEIYKKAKKTYYNK